MANYSELHMLLSLEWTYANHLDVSRMFRAEPMSRAEWAASYMRAIRA